MLSQHGMLTALLVESAACSLSCVAAATQCTAPLTVNLDVKHSDLHNQAPVDVGCQASGLIVNILCTYCIGCCTVRVLLSSSLSH